MDVYAITDLHLSINNPKPMDIFGGAWVNYVEIIQDNLAKIVKQDDIVLLGGDISWAMTLNAAIPDLNFIGTLPGKKVLLRGNHDYWWKSITAVRACLPPSVFAVQNDCIRFNNLIICGTRGWTVPEGSAQSEENARILNRERERAVLTFKAMQAIRTPTDRVIFLTHYPPFNSRLQPSVITEVIDLYKPDCVVYGHLHGKKSRFIENVTFNGIPYILASCDLLDNKPVMIMEGI